MNKLHLYTIFHLNLAFSSISISGEDLIPQYHKGIAVRYFFPEPGRVVRIENAELFRDRSWVHKLGFFVKPGDIAEPVTNHTKRAGFVITTGETRDHAVERAEQVVESIKIEIVDDSH